MNPPSVVLFIFPTFVVVLVLVLAVVLAAVLAIVQAEALLVVQPAVLPLLLSGFFAGCGTYSAKELACQTQFRPH